MTVTEQRDAMIASLARIEQKIIDFEALFVERFQRTEKDFDKVISRLDITNGNIKKNSQDISNNKGYINKIVGIGIGISAILGIAISILALIIK